MITIFKWIFLTFFAALAWLVTGYSVEYLRPYKKIGTALKRVD